MLSVLCIARNEALRVAYIDEVENLKEGKPYTEYFSKLVKGDIHGKDKVNVLLASEYTYFFYSSISLHLSQ